MKIPARGVLLVFLVLAISGCAHKIAEKKLEDVAKDWCETIRASQLISVYPLTEDLQPGDIFLVQLPVDFQQEAYKRKGFLPLDNLVHRMHPARYKEFYSKSFGVGDQQKPVPGYWLAPGANPNWSQAPSAKFPTYSFSARSGGGFSLAIPVQGVPIGLSLMGGDAAEGTITIAEAYTYGVDAKSLYDQVKKWAEEDKSVKEFLKDLGRTELNQNYLRIVTRVYLTGKLNISLQSSGQMAGGVTVGAGSYS
jgi:hypothetical protein